jgi:probable phosphoglycerate mutase
METEYVMRFDGCSKGNPGPSGAGAVIYKNNVEIWSAYDFVGTRTTNNVAEYHGLLLGLKNAILLGITDIKVQGDSLLVIKQMNGEYKVNISHLTKLYEEAKNYEKQFQSVTYHHIYRTLNTRADELSNQALIKIKTNVFIDDSYDLLIEKVKQD